MAWSKPAWPRDNWRNAPIAPRPVAAAITQRRDKSRQNPRARSPKNTNQLIL